MRMAEHSQLHAFVGHENPSIVRYARASGGGHVVGDVCDPEAVAAFARAREIDVAMVSADEPLAAGVVGATGVLSDVPQRQLGVTRLDHAPESVAPMDLGPAQHLVHVRDVRP